MVTRTETVELREALAGADLARLSARDIAALRKVVAKAKKPPSIPNLIWNFVVDDPGMTFPDLCTKLRASGHRNLNGNSVRTNQYNALKFLRILADRGKLTGLELPPERGADVGTGQA